MKVCMSKGLLVPLFIILSVGCGRSEQKPVVPSKDKRVSSDAGESKLSQTPPVSQMQVPSSLLLQLQFRAQTCPNGTTSAGAIGQTNGLVNCQLTLTGSQMSYISSGVLEHRFQGNGICPTQTYSQEQGVCVLRFSPTGVLQGGPGGQQFPGQAGLQQQGIYGQTGLYGQNPGVIGQQGESPQSLQIKHQLEMMRLQQKYQGDMLKYQALQQGLQIFANSMRQSNTQ